MAHDLTLNAQTLAYGNRANSAPNKPTSLAAGDFILSTLYIESSTAVTVPTGYTLLGSRQHTPGNNFWIYVAGTIATGSEGATIAWSHATADTTAWHKRVTGVDSGTFQDPATPVGSQGDGATPLTNPGITTVIANTAVTMVSGSWNSISYSASTLTERIDFGGETGMFADVQAGAGASGTKTATPSAAVDYVTLVLGLREQSATPDAPTADAATVVSTANFQANWTVGSGGAPTGYELDVATDSGFTAFVSGFNDLDVGLVTAYTVTGLTADTDYWYRVRAYNGSGTSASSGSATPTTAGQRAAPTSDVTGSPTWTGDGGETTNLYQRIDEAVPSDSDYIRSVLTPAADIHEVGLGTLTDPASSATHVVRYRLRKQAAGDTIDLVTSLRQGAGTQIAAWTDSAIGTAFATVERTLSGGEADAITDYADLRLRFSATQGVPAVAPTYVAAGTLAATATSGATMAPGLPAGNAANDIGVLVVHTSSNVDLDDAVTGWTKITPGGVAENNTAAQRVEVWVRRFTGTGDAPTVPGIVSAVIRTARIFCVRGCPTTGNAEDHILANRSNNAASATVTLPTVDVSTTINTLSVLAYAYEDDPSAASTITDFAAWSVLVTATGTDAAQGMGAWRANAGSGTLTGGTTTVSGGTFTNSVNVGLHFAFKPAPVAARANVSWAELTVPPGSGAETYTGTAAISLPEITASGAGTFTAPVYTATAAIVLPEITASGTGTFTAPVYTGSATPSLPALTAAGTGTFTAPVYTGSAAPSLPAMTATGAGTFTAPVYTGTATPSLPALTAAGTGTFTAPVYTGSAAVSLPPLTASGSGTHPYIGTAAPVLPALTASGSGTFTAPVYTGSAAVVLPPLTAAGTGTHPFIGTAALALPAITASGTGTFVAPVYTGSAAIGLPPLTATGDGIFATAVYSGTAAVSLPPLTGAGSGTFTVPTYTGSAAPSLPALTGAGSGTFVAPVYTGSAAVTLPALTATASGDFAAEVYSGAGAVVLPTITASGTGTFTVPTYTGSAAPSLPTITASGSGTFTAPVYTGSAALTLPTMTGTGTGTFAAALFEGTAALVLPPLTATGTGTFAVPVYTGAGAATLPALTAAGTGTATAPTWTGTAAVTLGALTASGVGAFSLGVPQVPGRVSLSASVVGGDALVGATRVGGTLVITTEE